MSATSGEHGGDYALAVTFYGVRGSTPSPGAGRVRYGGNTACVRVELNDRVAAQSSDGGDVSNDSGVGDGETPHPTIFFDFGTGARQLGYDVLTPGVDFEGVCLITHPHWDHIQGVPFFPPMLRTERDRLTVMAPRDAAGTTMEEVIRSIMAPPMFPVGLGDLPGRLEFVDIDEGRFGVAGADVLARCVPHTGRTMGYRLEFEGAAVSYIPDHQQPLDGGAAIHPHLRELCDDTDLLIFDAQYTGLEFERKRDWGHSTPDFAARVAHETGAKMLALFHHDPSHDDEMIDELVALTRADWPDLHIVAAAEGSRTEIGGHRSFTGEQPIEDEMG